MSGKSIVTVVDKRTIHTDALDILGRVIKDDDKVGRDAIHLAVEPVVAGEKVYAGQDVGRKEDGTFGTKGCPKYLGIVDPFISVPVQPGEKFFLVIYPRNITTLRHVWEHPDFGPEVHNPVTSPKLYSLLLKESGPNKINTIKAIRSFTSFGLKEAKDIADSAPCYILQGVLEEEVKVGWDALASLAGVEIKEWKGNSLTAPVSIPTVKPTVKFTSAFPFALTSKQKEAENWITNFANNLKKNEGDWDSEVISYSEIMEAADKYVEDGTYSFVSNSDVYDANWDDFWKNYTIITGKAPNDDAPGNFFSCSC